MVGIVLGSVLAAVVAGVGLYLYLMLTTGRCKSQVKLSGKTAIVTGSNTGIGFHTAMDLARRGARVILACRDVEKGQRACEEIMAATGNKDVKVKQLNLSSLKSVRNFAAEVLKEEPHLEILVNNAAVTGLPKIITEDGLESMFATNHFGPFLLTNLLLDLLQKSAPSRIVNVSSVVNTMGTIEFDNLKSEGSFSSHRIYFDSKLANVIFTRELARRLENTGVTAYSLHPGSVQTRLLRNLPAFIRLPLLLFGKFYFKTAEDGAQTSIYCAVSEEVADISGKYFVDCKLAHEQANPRSLDSGLGKKLWEVSEQYTGLAS